MTIKNKYNDEYLSNSQGIGLATIMERNLVKSTDKKI